MDSFFFNITDRRYKVSDIFREKEDYISRVDISNGLVFLESSLCHTSQQIELNNLDRMVMIVVVKQGLFSVYDHISEISKSLKEGEKEVTKFLNIPEVQELYKMVHKDI